MAPRTCGFRAAACFHLLVASLALLGGIALFIVGFWLDSLPSAAVATDAMSFLASAAGIKVLGGLLALFGLTSLLAARRRCVGVTFRVLYLGLALSFAGLLAYAFGTSLVALSSVDDNDLRKGMQKAWAAWVAGPKEEVCGLQYGLRCRGFDDGDCAGCRPKNMKKCRKKKNCVDCSGTEVAKAGLKPPSPKHGCFRAQINAIRSAETFTVALSGLLLLVILLDVFVSCRFPIHVADLVMRPDPDDDEIPEEQLAMTM